MGQAFKRPASRTSNSARRGDAAAVVGVLDIGTSKICCLISSTTHPLRVLGLGQHRAEGIAAGMVVDLDAAERAIRAAVARAEGQAGVTLREIHVGIAGGHLRSMHFAATAEVASGMVGAGDLARLMAGARAYCERDGRSLVHWNRIAYRLDGSGAIRDPRGMAGRTLAGDLHAVTADDGPLRNLRLTLERCFLVPTRFMPSALASARAVATADELRHGVTVIDMGAGMTSIAIIADDHDLLVASVPIGGDQATFAIKSALGTSLAEAERIKVLYGTLVEAASDERDVVTYPRLFDQGAEGSEGTLHQTTRAHLRRVVTPQIETLLAHVQARLVASGMQAYGDARIVLTGGASQLVGLSNLTGRLWNAHVRVAGVPSAGLGPTSSSPALATAFGLAAMAGEQAVQAPASAVRPAGSDRYLDRVGQWLRESF